MVRRSFIFLALLLLPAMAMAQKSLELYYIAHDHYESSLKNVLDVVRRNARYNTDRTVVFYLANRDEPVYFQVSPDDERKYTRFMETLNAQTSHTVSPDVDRLMLIDMFSEGRFLKTKGFDSYDKVVFNFYINPSFVQMDYCDAVIGRLYWDMELATLPKGKLEVNIFHHADDGGKYREDKLFGRGRLMGGFEPLVDTY